MSSTQPRPVADIVADLLAMSGVRRAYTVPGESFLPLLAAFDAHPELQLISTRHEGGAAFMAEADGKLTGMPAVVLATRAVGTANLAVGIHTARQDCTPLLALLGQVETEHLGNEAFQEVDLPAFLAEITVWASTVMRRDRVPETVARALARAVSGRRGPAAVALPSDLLEGDAPEQQLLLERSPAPAAGNEEVRAVAAALRDGRQPVVIAGQGSDHGALRDLARRYGLGVYAAFRRQDCFPNDDEHYLGHLTLGTPHSILKPLEDADVVLILGERLDETTTQGYRLPHQSSLLIHVYPDPAILGRHRRADIPVVADSATLCRQLLDVAEEAVPSRTSWWKDGHAAHLELARLAAQPDPGGRLHPGRAVDAIQRHAPSDTVVVNDAGNFSVYLHRQWQFVEPRTQAGPISGAMGYAVPGAIGASLARPERPVLGVAGDGGFLMTSSELETAVRLGLNTKFMVLQNGLHGTIAMHQARSGLPISASEISTIDIAGLARALGVRAWDCSSEDELDDAAGELLRHQGPAVLVVRTDPDLILPGQRLSQLGGGA